jgi:hypothetical protein
MFLVTKDPVTGAWVKAQRAPGYMQAKGILTEKQLQRVALYYWRYDRAAYARLRKQVEADRETRRDQARKAYDDWVANTKNQRAKATYDYWQQYRTYRLKVRHW